MTFISYSQNLEDVMLWRALPQQGQGFYIDVGAWDPQEDSVTLAFYERGWRGINIEPNAGKYAALLAARPGDVTLSVALSDTKGEQLFYDIPKTGLSTLDAEIAQRHRAAGLEVQERTVKVMTLREVCAAHAPRDIHFLKIDVEGLEAAVLAGADFTRFRPWLVVVESTEPNSTRPSYAAWEPGLLDAGYDLVYFDGLNRYYAADEKLSELAPAFSSPPNVFDDYVSAAGIRKAVTLQKAGSHIAELPDPTEERHAAEHRLQQVSEQKGAANQRAEALDVALQEAVAARKNAELRALEAERDARLAQADAERILNNAMTGRNGAGSADYPHAQEATPTGGRRIYYDASLVIRFGLETPVGLVRTEHYVAEFLARDPAFDIIFVFFDAALGGFRTLTREEAGLLRRILFHRYEQGTVAPAIYWEPEVEPDAVSSLALAQIPEPAPDPEPETCSSEPAVEPEVIELEAGEPEAGEPEAGEPEAAAAPSLPPGRLLLRRIRTASTLSAHEFDHMLVHYAVRLLPVAPHQDVARRLATRTVRRIGLHTARGGHSVVYGVTSRFRRAFQAGKHLIRPDPGLAPPAAAPIAMPEPIITPPISIPVQEPVVLQQPILDTSSPDQATAPMPPEVPDEPMPPEVPDEPDHPAGVIRFSRGCMLLSLGNSWDYLDYAYLHRICRHDGVRFVSVIFDVIAMQLPFSTPSAPHIYHRHWVEIGHSATHLLAISKFSAQQYCEYISEPNGLSPSLSYAYLPNFLLERAEEIGEIPVAKLVDRRFVMFCSTIETRKNHQLLLQLWDRLRLEFDPEELPILVFVGKWGWGTEMVRLLSERNYRLRSHLLVLDRASDAELIWIYRHARFTVFPSLSEGYGLAAAESLSFGTPVVIADCPALVEATEGLMPAHDPLDIMAWLEEMRCLIRDDVRLDELREAAARYRGPAYEAFADAIRMIARKNTESVAQTIEDRSCLVV